MHVEVHPDSVKRTRWSEALIRFGFGGAITVVAGLIAREFGPVVGGLFLAFPAVFPATVTLVAKHEREKKERDGGHGWREGHRAAGVDSAGAALGSLGLAAFAAVIWWQAATLTPWLLLPLATLAWIAVSVAAWVLRQRV